MIKEFREFIMRGNLIDLAVAFVMGVAFKEVVTAFTGRIVSPLIGLIFGIPDLTGVWVFGEIDEATGLPEGSVGAFLEASLDFVIIGFVMFLVVKAYNRAQAAFEQEDEEAAPEEPSEDIVLLREIRDSLNK
ncbi:MAG: large conductance mechanosensitive channel protein MscL [Acidimicrobiia bacterium]|nr:MAG: large conductance mechanosensitive channel protein MscL [Acidimicrobiia bacterium]